MGIEIRENSWRGRAGTTFETSKREVVASEAVVVSNHPLASAAGMETLARGEVAATAEAAGQIAQR
ncbi:MAG: hypothetical protein ACRDIY_22845, partial [Chloroflexota bacterium]